MSQRPRREQRHPDLQTAIKETAWKQIAEFGAKGKYTAESGWQAHW